MPLRQLIWKKEKSRHAFYCGERWIGHVTIDMTSAGFHHYCDPTGEDGHQENIAAAMKAVETSFKEFATQIFNDNE